MTEQDKIVVLEDNHRLREENDTLRKERDAARRERDLAIRLNGPPVTAAANRILVEQIRETIKERDAARVEVCEMTPRYEGRHDDTFEESKGVAVERGWDCFKEETQ